MLVKRSPEYFKELINSLPENDTIVDLEGPNLVALPLGRGVFGSTGKEPNASNLKQWLDSCFSESKRLDKREVTVADTQRIVNNSSLRDRFPEERDVEYFVGHNWSKNEKVVKNNPLLLGSINVENRDKDLCLEAVSRNLLALDFVPEKHLKDYHFVSKLLEKNAEVIKFINFEHFFGHDLLMILETSPAVANYLSREHWLTVLSGHDGYKLLQFLPHCFFTDEFLLQVNVGSWTIDKKDTDKVSECFCNLSALPEKSREYFLKGLLLSPFMWKSLEEHRVLEPDSLHEILESLPHVLPCSRVEKLADPIYPVIHVAENPFLMSMFSSLFQSTDIPNKALAEQFHQYTDSLSIDFQRCASDFSFKSMNPVGGRTALTRSAADNKEVFLKFLKENEDKDELIKECKMHYAANHFKQDLNLKSEIPVPGQLSYIPVSKLPAEFLDQFEDKIAISSVDGEDVVYFYSYQCDTPGYGIYAHSGDPQAAEQGILNALHDLGVWSSLGIMYTSVLPLFHASFRRWMPLHALFGGGYNTYNWRWNPAFPGCILRWMKGTKRPDFRHTGLADLGDYERFGDIQSLLKNHDSTGGCHPEYLVQNISFCNVMMEHILSATLIYARLHRDEHTFSPDNKEAVDNTVKFIQSAFEQYLQGFWGSKAPSLEVALGVSGDLCAAWLEQAAKETIFWTMPQYLDSSNPRHEKVLYFRCKYWSKKPVCPEVYPDVGHQPYFRMTTPDGEESLGGANCQFPLTALVMGLTRFMQMNWERMKEEVKQGHSNTSAGAKLKTASCRSEGNSHSMRKRGREPDPATRYHLRKRNK